MGKKAIKIKEVMTVPMPEQKAPDAVESIVGALMSLQTSQGWAIIVKILNDNIAYLEKAILDKIDPATKEVLSDKDVEELRVKRGLNIELRDTPQNYTKVVKDNGTVPEEYDPYFKTKADIIKAERAENKDDKGK